MMILVGKNVLVDGLMMIVRNEDLNMVWLKYFVVRKENMNFLYFVLKGNGFIFDFLKEQLKYIVILEWDMLEGLFEEDGINSKNVVMSVIELVMIKEEILKIDLYIVYGIVEDFMLIVIFFYIDLVRVGVE